jgi:hypothetical protein
MNTEQLLWRANRAVKFRRVKTKYSSNLTSEMKLFLRSFAGPARRNVLVPDAFKRAAGSRLAENCRIESLRAGVLKVKVKPGPYMFELRTRAAEIIEELKEQCPSSNIREIKLACSE